jgi:hypothetical protein
VDAGPHSRSRVTDYQVELDYLMEAVEEIAVGANPLEIAVHPDGESLYVANYTGKSVSVVVSSPTPGEVLRPDVSVVALDGGPVRFFGVAVAALIRRDDVEVLRKWHDVLVPLIPEAGPAVYQDERETGPVAYVVDPDTVRGDVLVVPGIGHWFAP